MAALTTLLLWCGAASATACVIVVAIIAWALVYDRRQHGRWTWKDDD
jgi:hypothetical protein